MRNAVQPQYLIQNAAAESFGRIARSAPRAPVGFAAFPTDSANDARYALRGTGDETLVRALAASGFGEAALLHIDRYRHLAAAELNAAARADRSQRLGVLVATAASAAARGLRQLNARFDRWRRRRATVLALQSLDDHNLRDIGLDRSEILSLAREIDDPNATRVPAVQSHRAH